MIDQPTNHKEIIALIKRISGQANFIGTPRIYVDIFDGDLVAAVWLNQVVYWDGKTTEPIGFYKTYPEWRKELGLSKYQVSRVAKECERLGLVNITFRKVYGTPKNHYLVIWPELLKVISATVNKPDSEETELSEIEPSESEETSPSMDSQDSSTSLSIEESTTESYIDIEIGITTTSKAWVSVLEQLKKEVSRDVFVKYLEGTRPVAYSEGLLIVKAGSVYARDWLADRVTSTAQRLLIGITNQDVEIQFGA
jgi:DNA-binding transcriptional regulator GbsR (MarR family)